MVSRALTQRTSAGKGLPTYSATTWRGFVPSTNVSGIQDPYAWMERIFHTTGKILADRICLPCASVGRKGGSYSLAKMGWVGRT